MHDINIIIQTAKDLIAQRSDGENHTVAAAVLADDGSVVTGLNLFHFNGGPCAELTALANVRAVGKEPSIIVAVGDRNRGVLAPCGRCRQVLADYYPNIKAVVVESGEQLAKPINELLPYTYDWKAQQGQ